MNRLSKTIYKSALLMIVLLHSSLGVAARADQSSFVMSAIENEAAGGKILAGEYAAAATSLSGDSGFVGDAFSKATNLCVALTLDGRIDAAEHPCNEALYHSRVHRRSIENRVDALRFHAVALCNLGVLRAVSGDLEGAERDFEQAAQIKTRIPNASLNLEHLRALRQRQTASTQVK